MSKAISFEEWIKAIPDAFTKDALWRYKVYRLSLYIADISWLDVSQLHKDSRTRSLADQLYRSLGSIGANIAEGYSRSSTRDQNRFYEYALGSARESRDWYYKSRHILGEDRIELRYEILSQIIRLLLTIISRQHNTIREQYPEYLLDQTHKSEE